MGGAVVLALAIPEVYSVFTFEEPGSTGKDLLKNEQWTIKLDHEPGNLGFDPLGLKPTDLDELVKMQSKELNNGRLAMIAVAGMVAQEVVTGQKLFPFGPKNMRSACVHCPRVLGFASCEL